MRVLQHRDPSSDGKGSAFIVPKEHIKQQVAFCGHKVDIYRMPNTNCNQCWFFWFINNTEFTQQSMLDFQKGPEVVKSLVSRFGKKFTKKLALFIEAVKQAKNIHDELDKETTEALEKPETFDIVFRADGRQAIVPTGQPSPFEGEPLGDTVDAEFEIPLEEVEG